MSAGGGAPVEVEGRVARCVDGERLWRRLMALARFGALPSGGVDRQALSEAEIEARGALVEWARSLGLEPSTDAIGNLFLRLEGERGDWPPVVTGSHIDTQPTGGKFDGAYGVLAGLEALEAVRAAGVRPRRSIEVVAWTNEEGSRFSPGMMGSEAFIGARPLADMLAVEDRDGVTVADALGRVLAAHPEVPQRPLGFPVAAFVEAHIEQGPELERHGKTVGVVTGIQGTRRFRVRVKGEAAHAGTEPRRTRRDALLAALGMVGELEALTADPEDVVRFTVGLLDVTPNVPSVVPNEVLFSIDLRHPDEATLRRLGDAIAPACERRRGPCEVQVREIATAWPLVFPESVRGLIRRVAEGLGVAHMDLHSAAGHDARQLHRVCPTGMIFVPCEKGISHNERENAAPADLAAGARVLAETLVALADREERAPALRA